MSHAAAVQVILEASHGQFDPKLLKVFAQCAERFEKIYHDLPG